MKRIILMLAAAYIITVPAFAQNVATVNGKPITQKSVDQFVKLLVEQQGVTDSPQLREQVKQEMINRQIFMQAAEQRVTKQPEVQTELELTRQNILIRAIMADFLKQYPISEEKVQAEYEKYKNKQSTKQEYKVSHILVDDEKTANDLLAQLKKDKSKFVELAKKNSKDIGSGEKGGN
jgi:peptidyl-prolyl cis-trans isomerase C